MDQNRLDVLKHFLKYCKTELNIQSLPPIKLIKDPSWVSQRRSFGEYNPGTNELSVYILNRNLADVCRSLAHELVHHRQMELNMIYDEAGETGSEIENEANALAGILMRDYGKLNMSVYDLDPDPGTSLMEMRTREKSVIGSGTEHDIYNSSNNPDVLFKVGDKEAIDKWYDTFKSNPEIFPKVFRVGKMPKDNRYYVEVEKLDVDKFENDWDDLELALEDIGALDVDEGESFVDLYRTDGINSKKLVNIGKQLYKHDKNMYDFYMNLLTIINECEDAILITKGKSADLDVHKYNFGYSKDGKIKCLDI